MGSQERGALMLLSILVSILGTLSTALEDFYQYAAVCLYACLHALPVPLCSAANLGGLVLQRMYSTCSTQLTVAWCSRLAIYVCCSRAECTFHFAGTAQGVSCSLMKHHSRLHMARCIATAHHIEVRNCLNHNVADWNGVVAMHSRNFGTASCMECMPAETAP